MTYWLYKLQDPYIIDTITTIFRNFKFYIICIKLILNRVIFFYHYKYFVKTKSQSII
jgi:hypothetical protein